MIGEYPIRRDLQDHPIGEDIRVYIHLLLLTTFSQ